MNKNFVKLSRKIIFDSKFKLSKKRVLVFLHIIEQYRLFQQKKTALFFEDVELSGAKITFRTSDIKILKDNFEINGNKLIEKTEDNIITLNKKACGFLDEQKDVKSYIKLKKSSIYFLNDLTGRQFWLYLKLLSYSFLKTAEFDQPTFYDRFNIKNSFEYQIFKKDLKKIKEATDINPQVSVVRGSKFVSRGKYTLSFK